MDLPTFGRPTIATKGLGIAQASSLRQSAAGSFSYYGTKRFDLQGTNKNARKQSKTCRDTTPEGALSGRLRERSLSFPAFLVGTELLRLGGRKNLAAIVGTAVLASSVRQTSLTALRASDYAGDGELPVGAASLISSCAGNFSLRYCHFRYTSLIEMPFRHIVYFFLSSSCCRTANLESGSLLQSQGPSLRFLPQRKQSPLQSSRHSSF
mgnify:CR=1 FL=1